LTKVNVTEWPANDERLKITFVQTAVFGQTGANTVDVVPVTPSCRVTVNQSFLTLSRQDIRYQNVNLPPAAGTVKVWASVLFAEGEVEPTRAAKTPLCGVFTIAVTPVRVQPVKSPVSKPPFTIPFGVTVTATRVECVLEPSVPVTVTV